jgi:hypothetical protein
MRLNGTFYCVKLLFIELCPRQFVEYHPQLQFGARHTAPNLAGIARPQRSTKFHFANHLTLPDLTGLKRDRSLTFHFYRESLTV